MKLHRLVVLTLAGVAVAGAASALIVFHYYRWASAPATECLTDAGASSLEFANQPREWANLAADATVLTHFITNGSDYTTPPFDPPDGTGSLTYPTFGSGETPYPFAYTMQLDTMQGGDVTWRSALTATCTGDGPASAVVVDWVPGLESRSYRWAYAPSVSCSSDAGGVTLIFASQPVRWDNLPASAEFETIYSENGVESPFGPYALPEGDGSFTYAPLGTSALTYPLRYAVRLDTKINSTLVYSSVLVGNCQADGPGTSHVFNVPEPAAASLAFAALLALVALDRRTALRGDSAA